jgi:hypothetical protein
VTTTLRYASVDNAGIAESPKSQTVTIVPSGGAGVTLVRQVTASVGSSSALRVPFSGGTGVGDGLVAAIALQAGSSASVSSVQDSSGGVWTRGAVGYLTGSNSRIELWYRLGAPSLTGLTISLSAAKSAGVEVSEWTGLVALDTAAGGSNPSSAAATTPSIATGNPSDLLIGAINYPGNVGSTLAAGSFTSLSDFGYSTGVHGRAAYALTGTAGSYHADWSLSGSSGGTGTAILALKTTTASR